MERLTEPGGSRCEGCQDAGECAYIAGEFPVPCPDTARYKRLKEYENTGLDPEQIYQLQGEVFGLRVDKAELEQYRALGPIDHLRELIQAEEAWKLVVSGKPVYVLLQDGAYYYPKTNGWYISEEKIGAVSLSGFYVGEPTDGVHFPYEQIGKTVLLTREEAEAALAGEDGEG